MKGATASQVVRQWEGCVIGSVFVDWRTVFVYFGCGRSTWELVVPQPLLAGQTCVASCSETVTFRLVDKFLSLAVRLDRSICLWTTQLVFVLFAGLVDVNGLPTRDCIRTVFLGKWYHNLVLLALLVRGPSQLELRKWLWRDGNQIFTDFWPVHCQPAACQPPGNSNHTFDGFFVPSALRFQSSDIPSSEHTVTNKALCTVASGSDPNSDSRDLPRQHSRQSGQTLVTVAEQSFQTVFSRPDLSATWLGFLRVPPTTAILASLL